MILSYMDSTSAIQIEMNVISSDVFIFRSNNFEKPSEIGKPSSYFIPTGTVFASSTLVSSH